MLELLLFVVQGYCVGHSAQGLLLSRRPHPTLMARPVDAVPLLAQKLILGVVAAVADAELQEHVGILAGEGGDVGADQGQEGFCDYYVMWLPAAMPNGAADVSY